MCLFGFDATNSFDWPIFGGLMEKRFDLNPILNSPYHKPEKHWHLDEKGKPTGGITDGRRASIHLVPIPSSQRNRKQQAKQSELELEEETKENPSCVKFNRRSK